MDNEYKKKTLDIAWDLIRQVTEKLEFILDDDTSVMKQEVYAMLYKLYDKYTFTPLEVTEKIASQDDIIRGFVKGFFDNLHLDKTNMPGALQDCKILIEKYICINSDNEGLFINDRDAYLTRVTADDEAQLARIDALANKTVPLQSTEMFFDSKKTVVDGKMCKKLSFVFQRKNKKCFAKSNALVVQFKCKSKFGYIKTLTYAEEADIKNVLQEVFRNYP